MTVGCCVAMGILCGCAGVVWLCRCCVVVQMVWLLLLLGACVVVAVFTLTAVVTAAIVLCACYSHGGWEVFSPCGCVVVAIAARLSQVSWLLRHSLRSAAAGRGGLLTPDTLPSQGIRLCTGQQKRTGGERDSSPGGRLLAARASGAPQPSLSDVGDTQHGYAGHSPRVGSSPNSWKPEGAPLRSTTSIPKNTFLHRNMICITRRRPCPSHCPELVKQAPPDKAECPAGGGGKQASGRLLQEARVKTHPTSDHSRDPSTRPSPGPT